MATASIAIPVSQSKKATASRRDPHRKLRDQLTDEANAIRSRMAHDVGLGGCWVNHLEFEKLRTLTREIERLMVNPTTAELLIAGFDIADETFEAFEIAEDSGAMKKEHGFVLLAGALNGRKARFEVPFEATYNFGKPKPLKGRFQKFEDGR